MQIMGTIPSNNANNANYSIPKYVSLYKITVAFARQLKVVFVSKQEIVKKLFLCNPIFVLRNFR